MKILVTGGLGFIGSNYIHYIIKKYPNSQIINLDAETYAANRANLKNIEKDPRYKFIKGDIRDFDLVKEVMKDIDWLVHMAAWSHVDRSIEPLASKIFVQNNVEGTAILLEAFKEEWGKRKKPKAMRFLYVGSDEEFGSIKKGSFSETDVLTPSSPYSSTKAGGNLIALSFYHSFGLPVIATRCTNNFGPYQHVEKYISRSITNLLSGQKIKLYGSGRNVRDWIYVLDHCQGILTVLKRGELGETYNIGAGQEYENLEIAKILCQKLNKDPKEWIEFVADRPGHDFRYSLDISKIKKLGWRPRTSLAQGLEKTIKWYQENRSWWREAKKETEKFYKKIGR